MKRFDGFAFVCKKELLNMYAFDLNKDICTVEPKTEIEVSMHENPQAIHFMEESSIKERLARGDRIFVACARKNPVAHIFAAVNNAFVGEINDWLNIGPKEVYLYDAHTDPRYRNKQIYPHLICCAASYFKTRSYAYAMIFSSAANTHSVRGITRCGFECYEVVHYWNFFGWQSWKYDVGERHVGARLGNEN
jgi:ribosomal protein S18 acetylase RimI-like enzyme